MQLLCNYYVTRDLVCYWTQLLCDCKMTEVLLDLCSSSSFLHSFFVCVSATHFKNIQYIMSTWAPQILEWSLLPSSSIFTSACTLHSSLSRLQQVVETAFLLHCQCTCFQPTHRRTRWRSKKELLGHWNNGGEVYLRSSAWCAGCWARKDVQACRSGEQRLVSTCIYVNFATHLLTLEWA
jgi:hypothetical protein